MNKLVRTDFLYARPSAVSGVARVFDLFGTLDDYNISDTPAEADAKAIASDWIIAGQDIVDAMELHDSEMHTA
jgi:hypothetical protein